MQVSGPDRSPPACANETVSGRLYQPLASATRLTVAVAPGAVPSYLKVSDAAALRLPARSVHVPEREAAASSGPEYPIDAVHVSGPERSPGACWKRSSERG